MRLNRWLWVLGGFWLIIWCIAEWLRSRFYLVSNAIIGLNILFAGLVFTVGVARSPEFVQLLYSSSRLQNLSEKSKMTLTVFLAVALIILGALLLLDTAIRVSSGALQ